MNTSEAVHYQVGNSIFARDAPTFGINPGHSKHLKMSIFFFIYLFTLPSTDHSYSKHRPGYTSILRGLATSDACVIPTLEAGIIQQMKKGPEINVVKEGVKETFKQD